MASKVFGIDAGTMFFQTAENGKEGKIIFKEIRNAFVELEASEDIEQVLEQNDWQYVRELPKLVYKKYQIKSEHDICICKNECYTPEAFNVLKNKV